MITYNKIQKGIDIIINQIKQDNFYFDTLVLITKGGLIGGYFLAKQLGIRNIVCISLQSYKNKKQGDLFCHTDKQILDSLKDKKVLVFDDLTDSGKTFERITTNIIAKELSLSCLYYKSHSSIKPNFFYKEVGENRIDFIYET